MRFQHDRLLSQCDLCLLGALEDEVTKAQHDIEVRRQNLRRMRADLKEIIDVDNGLLDSLVSKKTLSDKNYAEIANSIHNKADKFILFLLCRYNGDYSEIMEAFTETGQKHVVNFINSAGGMP
jgi:hypothetical protein